ncbi:MAG: type II toxin-antitoxin system VapC family toxin [Methanosarcinales archaeon Met12]|nr:MAG: type II toxin-antitoxin system VapC family toxin [Methanosarcinales archaeon Met12]
MYIDSNIFIFAAIDKEKLGRNCREIIRLINKQRITCASSFLVIDEVMWILKKNVGKDNAIKITKAILTLPIKWIELDKSVIIRMVEIYEKTTLEPRDAIHFSSMKETGLSTIVSEDKDFDNVEGLEKISASKCIEKYH